MNWKERIKQAEKRGFFTDVDKRLAWSSDTCAVGEKLNGNHIPYFSHMEELGIDFTEAVDGGKVALAKKIYKEIQKTK